MPGKEDSSSDKEQCLDLFLKIGLDERTAKNTIANNKVTANLTAVIHEVIIFIPNRPLDAKFSLLPACMPCSQAISNLMINFQAGVTDGCSRTVGNLIYTVKINFQCVVKICTSLHVSIESIYFCC